MNQLRERSITYRMAGGNVVGFSRHADQATKAREREKLLFFTFNTEPAWLSTVKLSGK